MRIKISHGLTRLTNGTLGSRDICSILSKSTAQSFRKAGKSPNGSSWSFAASPSQSFAKSCQGEEPRSMSSFCFTRSARRPSSKTCSGRDSAVAHLVSLRTLLQGLSLKGQAYLNLTRNKCPTTHRLRVRKTWCKPHHPSEILSEKVSNHTWISTWRASIEISMSWSKSFCKSQSSSRLQYHSKAVLSFSSSTRKVSCNALS